LTIEARHAGFVDFLLGQPLSENDAFDRPASHAEIITAVSPFIESLNGGPDPADELNNDLVILNFALLLGYLEAEFYGINVPNLFKYLIFAQISDMVIETRCKGAFTIPARISLEEVSSSHSRSCERD